MRFAAIMAVGVGAAAAAAVVDACKSVASPQEPIAPEPSETAVVIPATPLAAVDASVIDPDALPDASFEPSDEPEAAVSPVAADGGRAAQPSPVRVPEAGPVPRKGKPKQSNIIYE